MPESAVPSALERPLWAQASGSESSTLTDEIGLYSLAAGIYAREVLRAGYRFARTDTWPTSAEVLTGLDALAFHAEHVGQTEAITQGDGFVGVVNLSGGRARATVAANSPELVDEILAAARRTMPVAVVDPGLPQVPVTFWSLSQHGPNGRIRMIDVPEWAEITGNYAAATCSDLERILASDFAPGVGGQLMLWHGLPGTGKTYALRALAWEWRAWADLHYITDPETFFGQSAGYMLDVLLHDEQRAMDPIGYEEDVQSPEVPEDPRAVAGRWRLIVLEDAGEMMSADARERSGQGLSRLLNVVDGMIGQGLRVLVLVTTNEELRTLHPAVSRPGRCASKILFEPLGYDEAADWLQRRGLDGIGEARSVADLYALLEERETTRDRRAAAVGFA